MEAEGYDKLGILLRRDPMLSGEASLLRLLPQFFRPSQILNL
jgi:hypothetical protein